MKWNLQSRVEGVGVEGVGLGPPAAPNWAHGILHRDSRSLGMIFKVFGLIGNLAAEHRNQNMQVLWPESAVGRQ